MTPIKTPAVVEADSEADLVDFRRMILILISVVAQVFRIFSKIFSVVTVVEGTKEWICAEAICAMTQP